MTCGRKHLPHVICYISTVVKHHILHVNSNTVQYVKFLLKQGRLRFFLLNLSQTITNHKKTTIGIMPKIHGAVTINLERCKGCNLCVVACPTSTLSLQAKEVNDRGYHFAFASDPESCIGCAACATVCPDACIEVYRVVEK